MLIECSQKILKEVKASREYPEHHCEKVKEKESFRQNVALFQENLYLVESALQYTGISTILKSQLRVWTSGDIST